MPSTKKTPIKPKARTAATAARQTPYVLTKCSQPGCDCTACGPFALYRTGADGRSVFTGIVCPRGGNLRTDAVRLNDVSGPLDGPGHAVTDCEFATHMSFYPDTTLPFKPVALNGLLTPTEAAQYWDDAPTHVSNDVATVRAGDRARLACMDRLPGSGQLARERFWIIVHAVIPFPPTLIGSVVEPLYWLPAPGQTAPLDKATLLQVPLANVLDVGRGPYWA